MTTITDASCQTGKTQTKKHKVPRLRMLPLRGIVAPLGMTVGGSMPREHCYYVYIMQSSSRRVLHIGMTNNLHRRVFQHKPQEFEGFSDGYDTVRLVYWESSDDAHKTIAREKQLKNWRRKKKLWLIARMNPEFRDLAVDWYKKESIKARRA